MGEEAIEKNDLFSEWLKKKKSSKWIKRALTDRSYKDIYRKEYGCEMPDNQTNFELATYGDAILKMGLMKILIDKNISQPTEKKKDYESDRSLVIYIASKYNLLSEMKYNEEIINIKDYKYDKYYKIDKNGKKKGNHCKFIATCVEAMIAAIYIETDKFDLIVELLKDWISFIDSENKQGLVNE